jgi:hypothetical protein
MRLWLLLLTGPIAWFFSLCASFAAAPPACWWKSKSVLFAIPCAALLAAVAAGLLSWRNWSAAGREFPGDSGGEAATSRVLTSGGVLLNGFFILVILAQFIVPSILGVCQ